MASQRGDRKRFQQNLGTGHLGIGHLGIGPGLAGVVTAILATVVTFSLLHSVFAPLRQAVAQAQPQSRPQSRPQPQQQQQLQQQLQQQPQAQPRLIPSTLDLSEASPDRYRIQGDRRYSLHQVIAKPGSPLSHDELWVTDGQSAQGQRLYRWPARTNPLPLKFLGSTDKTLLLSDLNGQLWQYDGKAVREITPASPIQSPQAAASLGDRIFWTQETPKGSELWVWDGKTARLIDRLMGKAAPESNNAYPSQFTPLQNHLLFTTGLAGGLWRTDGRTVSRIADINPAAQPFTPWGDRVFMEAETKAQGWELWTSDGKTTQSLGDLHPGSASSAPQILGGLSRSKDLLFLVRTPKGHELWATQGTKATTRSLKLINSQPVNLIDRNVATIGDRLFFIALTAHSTELWSSDGTSAKTQRLAQFMGQSSISNLTVLGDRLLFSATDRNGNELWVSDSKGTRLLRDLYPGSTTQEITECPGPMHPAPLGLSSPLAAPEPTPTATPTATPTITATPNPTPGSAPALIPDPSLSPSPGVVPPGPPQGGPGGPGGPPPPPCLNPQRRLVTLANSSSPQQLTTFKGQVYFLATTPGPNSSLTQALWISDGSDRGTRPLQTIPGQSPRIQAFPNWLAISSDPSPKPKSWILR